MGYNTQFEGSFELDKPLTSEQARYLEKFSRSRRVTRDPELAEKHSGTLRKAVGLPIGEDGQYCVCQMSGTSDITDSNTPPADQPGLWCHWTPSNEPYHTSCNGDYSDMTYIVWDCGDKFYHYVEWIGYLITNFLEPWGYVLNGSVTWRGDDFDDIGVISVKDNVVEVYEDVLELPPPHLPYDVKTILQSLADYNHKDEADDFLEQMGDFHWKTEDEGEIEKAMEEIEYAVKNSGAQEVLELIDRHIVEPAHIYSSILAAYVLIHEMTMREMA